MSEPPGGDAKRIEILDLWRSLCVFLMLAYHTVYDLALFGALPAQVLETPLAKLWRFLGGGGFILLSGVCVRLSRAPLRRGFQILCAAGLVTVCAALVHRPIAFGALHLLGLCMLLWGRFHRTLDRASPWLWLALFPAAWLWTSRVTVPVPLLYPLGFRSPGFFSADYYPLLPWGLLFLTGTGLEKLWGKPFSRKTFPAWLTFCGRHSLAIYLLHQPVIFLLCRLSL